MKKKIFNLMLLAAVLGMLTTVAVQGTTRHRLRLLERRHISKDLKMPVLVWMGIFCFG
jgi:hypothetical protein